MLARTAIALVAAALFADQTLAHDNGHRHAAHLRRGEGYRHHHTTVVVTRTVTVDAADADYAPTPAAVVATTLMTQVQAATTTSISVEARSTDGVVSSSSTTTGGKRGIAYNDVSAVNVLMGAAASDKFSYAYNWDSNCNGLLHSGLSFVPMLWGNIDIHTSRWQANADAMIAAGSTHLLSFNEPDNAGQANMSPADAAAAHVKWMNPYAGKSKIGSPAITNSNIAGQGLDWLTSFMDSCNSLGCQIDFCVTHWYHVPSAAQSLFDHIAAVSKICGGKKVWVTEFAPVQASDSDIDNFLPEVLSKLDLDDTVEAYFYFYAAVGSLLSDASSLSSYGKIYATN